jgi:hypothetical protein
LDERIERTACDIGQPIGEAPMDGQQVPGLSDELQSAFEQATAFAGSRKLMEVFSEVARDPKLWEEASKDPAGFLRARGVKVPKKLDVGLLDDPVRGMPTPDFEFFTIRLFNCRTVYVKKKDGPEFEKTEFCLGFEITPHSVPGGPIGR